MRAWAKRTIPVPAVLQTRPVLKEPSGKSLTAAPARSNAVRAARKSSAPSAAQRNGLVPGPIGTKTWLDAARGSPKSVIGVVQGQSIASTSVWDPPDGSDERT